MSKKKLLQLLEDGNTVSVEVEGISYTVMAVFNMNDSQYILLADEDNNAEIHLLTEDKNGEVDFGEISEEEMAQALDILKNEYNLEAE